MLGFPFDGDIHPREQDVRCTDARNEPRKSRVPLLHILHITYKQATSLPAVKGRGHRPCLWMEGWQGHIVGEQGGRFCGRHLWKILSVVLVRVCPFQVSPTIMKGRGHPPNSIKVWLGTWRTDCYSWLDLNPCSQPAADRPRSHPVCSNTLSEWRILGSELRINSESKGAHPEVAPGLPGL